jgi:hypothetical protein
MVLAGRQVDPPLHGFGADYDGAFLATHLVRVRPIIGLILMMTVLVLSNPVQADKFTDTIDI